MGAPVVAAAVLGVLLGTSDASVLAPPVSTRSLDSTTQRLTYDTIYSGSAKSDAHSGYGYSPYDYHGSSNKDKDKNCEDFQTIGIGAGAASLLALGIFLLLNNNNAAMTTTTGGMTMTGRAGTDPWLVSTTISATCAAGQLLETDLASLQARQSDDGCFAEMIGALAGLASLGALSGYSLSQSSQALMTAMRTIMTTMTTTMTTGGRDLTDVLKIDPRGLEFVSGMTSLAMTPDDLTCTQYSLCQLVQESVRAGQPYSTAVPLAGLPLSWLISKTSGHRFSDLCSAVQTAHQGQQQSCNHLYPHCSNRKH